MKTILSFDPGVHNAAYAVIVYKGPKDLKLGRHPLKDMQIKEVGLLNHTIVDLVHPYFANDLPLYKAEVEGLIKKYKPDVIILERFQNRGRSGTTIEAVNIMIGVLAALCLEYSVKMIMVIAGQWKNNINRHAPFVIEDIWTKPPKPPKKEPKKPKKAKPKKPKRMPTKLELMYKQAHFDYGCPPHIIDTMLINMYGNSKLDAYSDLKLSMLMQHIDKYPWKVIIKNVTAAYLARKRRR